MVLLALIFLVLLFAVTLLLRRQQRQHQRALIRQFYTWVGQPHGLDATLQQWINALSDAEAELLVKLLQGYCASLNWELEWLFAPQIEKAPLLRDALVDSVRAYARTILTSLQMEVDVRAYQAYVAFSRKPTNRKQSALVQKLYRQISAAGIIPPLEKVKRRFLSKQPTRKHQITVIQQAFEQKPAQAMEVLKQLLIEDAATSVRAIKPQVPISQPPGPAVITPLGATS